MITTPESKPKSKGLVYRRIFGNRSLMLLWSGQTISDIGDIFFNVAVMWVIYQESGSVLQTAIIQVVWHLSSFLFGPLAGALADHWDRKRIMVITNFLSAAVVGGVAAIILVRGQAAPLVIFITVFLLNSLATFTSPAEFSILPELVGRDILADASGLFTAVNQSVRFVGSMLAGFLVAGIGAGWAIVSDSLSFLCVVFTIGVATLPERTVAVQTTRKRLALFKQIHDGWKVIVKQPVIRALVWLSILINISSFLGPLYPALISQRLHSGAGVYGLLQAISIIGSAIGGICAGACERRFGAGRLLAAGWGMAGFCTVIVAFSTWVPLTAFLEMFAAFSMTLGSISMGAVKPMLIPENYRGRVQGTMSALAVIAIPLSSLIGGWATDQVGVTPVFALGGAWVVGVAVLAWGNSHVRAACVKETVKTDPSV